MWPESLLLRATNETFVDALHKDDWVQIAVREPSLKAYRKALSNPATRRGALASAQCVYEAGVEWLRQNSPLTSQDLASFDILFDPDALLRASRANTLTNETVAALEDFKPAPRAELH